MTSVYFYTSAVVLIIAYIIAYVAEPDVETFDGWMNVLTHLAAFPAIFKRSSITLQISLTTAVSVIYHIVEALAQESEYYKPLLQLDVGMSVALIANVLFIYMDDIPWVPITFLATSAAAFPEFNIEIAGFVLLFGYPVTTILSYTTTNDFQRNKWILLFLQVSSVTAYLLADTFTTYTLHPIWHVASLLSIYYMILLHEASTPAKFTATAVPTVDICY